MYVYIKTDVEKHKHDASICILVKKTKGTVMEYKPTGILNKDV